MPRSTRIPRLVALGAMVCGSAVLFSTAVTARPQPAAELSLRALYSKPPAEWPAAEWDDAVLPEDRHELAPVPDVVFPADNPFDQKKAELGRRLFWDPRLSGSAMIACVSCHHPDLGWSDGKTTSQGHQLIPLDRNAPTLMGAALQPKLMWDGRAETLEDQALLPIVNSKEMHGDYNNVTATLNAIPEYVAEFKTVFNEDEITLDQIQKAIATFERTLVPGRSSFDAFLAGRTNSLDDQELRGLHLFRTKGRCINCHNGPLLSDGAFHNVGLTYYKRRFQDLGRYEETKNPEDVGKFRTPTLRNVARTSPYMHNGLFELEGLINLYNAGMPTERVDPNDPLSPKKDPILRQLMLTPGERADLQAFLTRSLEEPRTRVRAPGMHGLYDTPTTRPAN